MGMLLICGESGNIFFIMLSLAVANTILGFKFNIELQETKLPYSMGRNTRYSSYDAPNWGTFHEER